MLASLLVRLAYAGRLAELRKQKMPPKKEQQKQTTRGWPLGIPRICACQHPSTAHWEQGEGKCSVCACKTGKYKTREEEV